MNHPASRAAPLREIALSYNVDHSTIDGLHSEQNVRFEMDHAWAIFRPGGAIVVDDIDANWGFKSFVEAFSGHRPLICEAEPLRPDLRRFNKKGLFGIILKRATASRPTNP